MSRVILLTIKKLIINAYVKGTLEDSFEVKQIISNTDQTISSEDSVKAREWGKLRTGLGLSL